MPRSRKSSEATWRTSLAKWVKSTGSTLRPGYSHEEYGQIYALEPVSVEGHPFYVCEVHGGKASSRVTYVTEDGGESPTLVLFKTADEGRRAASDHNRRLRGKRHAHPLAVAFRSKFRRV